MSNEFKPYPKIMNLDRLWMTITQKLHGTNAQVLVNGNYIVPGSRTRFLSTSDDNYGFARFVEENRDFLIGMLGDGIHYGEWCGPGINSGEGLKEKSLFLFNHHKFKDVSLPKNVFCVPVLFEGPFSHENITKTMQDLKVNGSQIVPGFKKVEGIVIQVGKEKFKCVFDKEETSWVSKKERAPRETIDVSNLIQKLRMEKLLSRDERYVREFPESLPSIVKDYIADLTSESDPNEIQPFLKELSRQLFNFAKKEIQLRRNPNKVEMNEQ